MRFVTVRSQDPELIRYLRGTFSKSQRALPLDFYPVSLARPLVTFRLMDVQECRRGVSFAEICARLLRLPMLGLTVGALAMMTVMIPEMARDFMLHQKVTAFALVCIFLLHGGAHALNDYFDHVKGVDLVQNKTGSRVIQNGWLAAWQVQYIGLGLLAAGLTLGLAILLREPRSVGVIGVMGALGVAAYSSTRRGLKYYGLSETVLLFLCGPILCGGYQLLLHGRLTLPGVLFGLVNGTIAAQIIFLRNWQNLPDDAALGVRSLAVRLGFDRCRLTFATLTLLRWFFVLCLRLSVNSSLVDVWVLAETLLLARVLIRRLPIRNNFSRELRSLRHLLVKYTGIAWVVLVLLRLAL